MKTGVLYALSFVLLISVSCTGGRKASAELARCDSLSSPEGVLSMQFRLLEDGTPQYALQRRETAVILPSRLGFELRGSLAPRIMKQQKDGTIARVDDRDCYAFDSDFEVIGTKRDSFDETWETVWGEERFIRNRYNELLVCLLLRPSNHRLDVRFRLYDDGLGFRYEFPDENGFGYFVIKEEKTEFAMAGDHTAWWIPGDFSSQEYEYTTSRLSEIRSHMQDRLSRNAGTTFFSLTGVQTSLQMKTDEGLYVNLHEAALVNYPCMHLNYDEKTKTFTSFLTPDAQGWKGYMQTPCHTPWRSIQVAGSAVEQLSSRLVLNLNDPCAYDDVSWIHPTKYMGVWWEMIAGPCTWSYTNEFTSVHLGRTDYSSARPHGRHGANNEKVREYIDFAAQHGFDQLLVEGWNIGWEDWAGCWKDDVFDFVTPYPDFDLPALNAYAHSKGIKLMMHHETSSSARNYERHLEAAYDLMNRYGYDAVKSGYVGDILPRGEYHYGQWMVNHYLYCITEAARHKIMVNAHEAIRPTGLCRTYPNLIGNESARGTEYQAFGGTVPEHVTILPFTRLNGGPMDYTPGIFEADLSTFSPNNGSHVQATLTNQLALYLTMYSPLQMAADLPKNYAKYPDAFQFIKDVAVDWQKSRYLFAEPGDYLIVARQSRDKGQWFLGGVTDENERTFYVPMNFLDSDKRYQATFYTDAPDAHYQTNNAAYRIEKRIVTAQDVIPVRMAPGGGFAVSFKEF
ncbi:MAG: glycoside hydrolase family 97 protein [Bacteroidales bacterium]|nr:glycoside hydrolase family 97 protein [Bacteroidales bacterium]